MLATLKIVLFCACFLLFTQLAISEQLLKTPEFELLDRLDTNSEFLKRFTTRKYCGRVLSDTLSYVCRNVYKRLVPTSDESYIISDIQNIRSPYLPRHIALTLKSHLRQRRQSGGIVEECCHKSCSIHELKSYCGSF